MMNPAAFVLNNNRTALVVYALVLITGIQTFFTIGRLEYPEFTIRSALVMTRYPGRTAEQVEKEVTEAIEQGLRQMSEVKSIRSTSKPGISMVTVEIQEQYFDMEDIWTDMRNRIEDIRLPDGAERPQVDDDYGDVFPYVYALKGDGFADRELEDAAEKIRDQLLIIDGVAKVEFHGEQEERVFLEFSSGELAAYGISPQNVMSALASQNTVATSGDVLAGRERLNLVSLGEFESLQELADFRVALPGEATTLRMSDILEIKRDYVDPPRSRAHFNGERVLCIAVSMIDGGVVTEIGARITERLEEIQNTLPIGLDIETMFFQPRYVDQSIRDFVVNLGQAFFFVVLVMLLFAGWRIAIIVGVLVPSAIFTCFTLMPTAGVLLEMMSIAALIIALGLLVDNAVVVSEQILVRFNAGEDRKQAVIESVKNLMIPLLAASGTTIAAFSPIALAPGATSEFTYSLFAVVSLTLLSSWVLSITIIPLFCYYFLKPLKRDTLIGRLFNLLYRPYEWLLRLSLRWRWTYPLIILGLTAVAVWGFRFVPNIFFPPNERGQFVVDFELPLGTDIAETERKVTEFERWLVDENSEVVKSVSAWIGNGGPRWYLSLNPEQANPNYSLLSVLTHTEDPGEVGAFVESVNRYARENFPSARVQAKPLENGPPVGDPIQIELFGEDSRILYQLRDRIIAKVTKVEGMYDLRDDWGAWIKQVSIDPDPIRSARLGIYTSSLADSLNLQFNGQQVTTYREGDNMIPVVMRSRGDFRERPERLPDLPIFTQTGVVPLSQIADTEIEILPGSILREDTIRVMTIKGKVRGRFSSEALADIQPLIAEMMEADDWPEGYTINYAGESAESGEAQRKIGSVLPISLAILSLILIGQFNSLRRFFIIFLTIPPMMCGVVPGLLLTGSTFGFMTMLGMIALMGIIVNNAILLIDETDAQLEEGKDLEEGIVDAAKSRLRPIVMTTVTTIIGLAPLAISGGGMWSSMAYAMMFGLAFATLLTLLLCPVLYYLFFDGGFGKKESA